MIQFYRKAINFTILIVAAIALLLYDAYLILNGYPTFSETIWDINQRSLALAFGVGMICGHCFTVPKDNVKG